MKKNQNPPFKVLIVGGSISGLTLAHALSSAGIEYTVLEARSVIDPQVGQSIIIMPNGARILDQLGVGICEGIEERGQGLREVVTRRGDGGFISRTDWPEVVSERLGYQHTIIERTEFLRVMYDKLEHKERVLLGKRVQSVEQLADGVIVRCADGTEYHGAIVVGADGIHSRVREEMWRCAEENGEGELVKRDRISITAEYNCIFGIASPHPTHKQKPGIFHLASSISHSSLVFTGKNSLPLWFFISRMPRRYPEKEIPRYSKDDMVRHIEEFKEFQMIDGVSLGELWERTEGSGRFSFVPLEEATNECWTWGRFVGIGDAVHKMTPNLGQGGNQAIESAAVLANNLVSLLSRTPNETPSLTDIEAALKTFQKARHKRATLVTKISNNLTRAEALATLAQTIRFLYLRPIIEEKFADYNTKFQGTAPCLDFLPLPERSLQGSWSSKGERGIEENKKRLRALL